MDGVKILVHCRRGQNVAALITGIHFQIQNRLGSRAKDKTGLAVRFQEVERQKWAH